MTMTDIEIASAKESAGGPSFVVVDVGKKQKRKAIKQLRKGKGKLTRKVEGMISELRESSALPDGSPLVVIVREKKTDKKRARRLFAGL